MLQISQEIIDAITAHAREQAPLEACGYLAARAGIVVGSYPLTNVDASRDHFSLSPAEQFTAVREMRATGLQLRAIYHSHPASPARPSEEDIKLAYDPGISYVIVSLAEENPVVRSFRIRASQVEQEDIEIVPPSLRRTAPTTHKQHGSKQP
jgi:proteasome lid subunit RPN8/RPN11